jgi:hypothetical protein
MKTDVFRKIHVRLILKERAHLCSLLSFSIPCASELRTLAPAGASCQLPSHSKFKLLLKDLNPRPLICQMMMHPPLPWFFLSSSLFSRSLGLDCFALLMCPAKCSQEFESALHFFEERIQLCCGSREQIDGRRDISERWVRCWCTCLRLMRIWG